MKEGIMKKLHFLYFGILIIVIILAYLFRFNHMLLGNGINVAVLAILNIISPIILGFIIFFIVLKNKENILNRDKIYKVLSLLLFLGYILMDFKHTSNVINIVGVNKEVRK
jgi:hypothetical protein